MKKLLYLALFLISGYSSFSQLSITGTSSSISVANNAPAVVVDGTLAVTTASSIPSFKVSISTNYNSGDVLAYTGSLPSGVTANYASGVLTFTGSATAANYQTLLRTVTFNTTSSVTSTRTITFQAGIGTNTYWSTNGHYYNYISGSFSWTGAKADAASKNLYGLQGYLVTVTTSAENTLVNSLGGRGWIGGSDAYDQINAATGSTTFSNQANSEGKWYWVTGPEKGTKFSNTSTVVTYANWIAGEPNNSSSSEHYAENAWADGYWNDSQNSGTLNYLIEYGGTSGDPVVDLSHSRDITMIATQLLTQTSGTDYQLHATGVVVDPNVSVYGTTSITNAKVTISGNFNAGDALTYTGTLPSGVTVSGTGYNATTGVLSFTGTTTPANWQTLFRTVKFSSTSNAIGNRDVTFSVGNNVAFTNGHFYESVTTGATWANAKTLAAAKTYMGLTGYLATITSSAENDFIKQKIGTDAWIGLSDANTEINAATGVTTYSSQTNSEGKFYWVTGPEKGTQVSTSNAASGSVTGGAYSTSFNNWNLGEPNNSGTENYGEIYASGSAPGKWNDLNGTQSLMYVVEYGGLPSDPLLSLSANAVIVNNAVLPVTGLELNTQVVADAVLLKFSTITEINCDHFDILHSTDGISYKKIGSIKGSGTTDTRQTYEFVHTSPAYGLNFYKLQQFDIDYRYKYSAVKQINYGNAQTLLSPNPAHSRITVFHNSPENHVPILVYNMSGKVMYRGYIDSGKTYLDIQAFPIGLYVAEIKGKMKSTRIMFVKN